MVIEWFSRVHDVIIRLCSLILTPSTYFARDGIIILVPVILVNINIVLCVVTYFRPFVTIDSRISCFKLVEFYLDHWQADFLGSISSPSYALNDYSFVNLFKKLVVLFNVDVCCPAVR